MNDPHLWWYVARAGGLVAWGLSALSILWGLALSTRVLGRRPSAPWLLDLHRFLGTLTLVFLGLHLCGLWADGTVAFGPVELLVPMASTWRPGAVAWGIVGLDLLVAVEVTSRLRRRIGARAWRVVHLSSVLAYVSGTVHLFAAGSDAGVGALGWVALVTSGLITYLVLCRLLLRWAAWRTPSPAPGRVAAPATLAEALAPLAVPVVPSVEAEVRS